MASQHRVVILGGGFGGLYAAQALKHAPVSVTVIDKRNFHLFQPLLYQVATGSLSPGEIAAPIRGVLSRQQNTQVLLGEVVDIDPEGKKLLLSDGAQVEYDSLIVATGSQSTFFGHDEWNKWAPPLKSIEDATRIRQKILLAFEIAERTHDPAERRAWLTFVIVGAGATGVELGGALGEIANHTLKSEFRSIRPEEAKIIIVDTAQRVLGNYPEDLSNKAEQFLIQLGVRTRGGLKVTCVDDNGVTVEDKVGNREHIASKTVLWAAGVAISDFGRTLARRTGAPTEKSGKIQVAPDLTVPGYPAIFVVGDLAFATDKKGKPLPGVAQVAMQGGKYAANAIVSRLRGKRTAPFHYFDKGDLAVIGRAKAVANVFGVHLAGLPAWLVWLFIHLMYIVEFQSRILVFVQWGLQYLTYNRGARLITGTPGTGAIHDSEPVESASTR
ncbi:MAG TPA: NAD(P)/FAD-dependent oxidoreductase [Bryobacteraceae bacterium]|nr:NAD(P)/FAD-dependent oxidoreductase [Bryobacteraceae bacterium]